MNSLIMEWFCDGCRAYISHFSEKCGICGADRDLTIALHHQMAFEADRVVYDLSYEGSHAGLSSDGSYESHSSDEEIRKLAERFEREELEARKLKEETATAATLQQKCIQCPHCDINIEVTAIACSIFICGVTNNGQVNQHDEANAARLKAAGLLQGCAGQFTYDGHSISKCTGR